MSWSITSLTSEVCRSIFNFCDFLTFLEFMLHPVLVVLSTSPLPAWAQSDGPCPLHSSPRGLATHSGVSRGERFWLMAPGRKWSERRGMEKRVPIFAFFSEFPGFFSDKNWLSKVLIGFRLTFCWPQPQLFSEPSISDKPLKTEI